MSLTLKKLTLTDQTMIANRTLNYQERPENKRSSNKQVALVILSESCQEESPNFEGCLTTTMIEMPLIRLNFNPVTLNKMIKFFVARRPSTRPVNDNFQIAEEYPLDFKPPTLRKEETDSHEEDRANIFDTDCQRERTKKSKLVVVFTGVRVSLLHPKYEMELFRLETPKL